MDIRLLYMVYMARLGFLVLFSLTLCNAQQYVISRIAGGGGLTTSIPPMKISLSPSGVTVDGNNNVYFASGNSVYKLDSNGNLTRIAGRSQPGFSGDGGPAIEAQLSLNIPVTGAVREPNGPQGMLIGLATDSAGNLFITDFGNNRIRRVAPDGIITTVAGTGVQGFSGDGGPAVAAELYFPEGVAIDAAGNLFVTDTWNNRIRKISPQGIITTVAGTGLFASSGDGGPALKAALTNPSRLAFDTSGNLYALDEHELRRIGTDGTIDSVSQITGMSLAIDSKGNLYVGVYGSIQVLSPSGAYVNTLSAPPQTTTDPRGLAFDSLGTLFIANFDANQLEKVDVNGNVTTIAGTNHPASVLVEEDGVPAAETELDPYAVATDGSGDLFISEPSESRVRKISNGVTATVAGGNSAVAGVTTTTPLGEVFSMVADGGGNLFLADSSYGKILRLTPAGVLTNVASTYAGYSVYLALDSAGNLFFSELSSVYKLLPDGTVTTVAGAGGPTGTTQLTAPGPIAIDGDGDLFISESNWIWKLTSSGSMTRITDSSVVTVTALACDQQGNLYIASDSEQVANSKQLVQEMSPGGALRTIAGTGQYGLSGDGGIATNANLRNPSGLAIDSNGGILISDSGNGEIRKLTATSTPVVISAVVDAASERTEPLSPGKIVAIYGEGLGPGSIAVNQPSSGAFGNQVAGTSVTFNGIPAAMYYASAGQSAAVVPYEIDGASSAQVVLTSSSGISQPFTVQIAPSAPSLFTANATGSGQLAAQNHDFTLNDAAHPAAIGSYIILYATGEGQLTPGGVDGQLASAPYPKPVLPIQVTIGGIPAPPAYAGSAPTEIEGLMQLNVQIPQGVQPGGYVPVTLQVGKASNTAEATWISVSSNLGALRTLQAENSIEQFLLGYVSVSSH